MLKILITYLLLTASVHAKDSPVNRMQSSEARQFTLSAIKSIEKSQWDEAYDYIAASQDPLASKLYLWLLLTDSSQTNWTNQLFIKISRFIRRNPEWPKINGLKIRAEQVMPQDLPNDEVIGWFVDFPPRTSVGMGRYMDAMIIDGKADHAREFMAQWWARTLLTQSEQSQIFRKYGGYLTVTAHKKRFDALLYKGKYSAAREIGDVLGQGYPALADARIGLRQNTARIGALIDKVPSYLQDDPGLLYERLRWRRKRGMDDGALEILSLAIDSKNIQNRSDWWTERHSIVRGLIERGEYTKAYEISSKHFQTEGLSYAQSQWLTGWLALRFMNKPTDAFERFSAMYAKVETPISKSRAAYWTGRAAKAMKQRSMARRWFKRAAEFQTAYYGQLARVELSLKHNMPKESLPRLTDSVREAYAQNELVQASDIFRELGMNKRANAFLNAFLSGDATPKAYRYAAEKMGKEGNYKQAVKIAKKATKKGLFLTKQSYPTITKHLEDIHDTEWALVHALIRQESMFDFDARSHAGALGLMQLMPATAREVAGKIGVTYNKSWLTQRPKYNMVLGSSYISRLIDRFDGNYVLAIAGYNAGPGRVNRWIKKYGDPRDQRTDEIDWIELIPIYETRNYVQRVMEGLHIYRLRLKGIQKQPIMQTSTTKRTQL